MIDFYWIAPNKICFVQFLPVAETQIKIKMKSEQWNATISMYDNFISIKTIAKLNLNVCSWMETMISEIKKHQKWKWVSFIPSSLWVICCCFVSNFYLKNIKMTNRLWTICRSTATVFLKPVPVLQERLSNFEKSSPQQSTTNTYRNMQSTKYKILQMTIAQLISMDFD